MNNDNIVLVPVSGVFKQSGTYFYDAINFWSSLGYSCFPFRFPRKDSFFFDEPDPKLGKVSLEDYAEELYCHIALISKSRPGAKIIPVGHSMGAMIIQMTAQHLGKKINGMVLLCPVPSREIKLFSLSGLLTFIELLKYGDFRNKPVKRSFRATEFGLFNKNMPDDEKKKAYEESLWESGKVMYQVTRKRPYIDHAKINIPTYVIGGYADKLISREVIKDTRDKYHGTSDMFDASHDILYGPIGIIVMQSICHWITDNVH
jgi:non-heme chloroperoxidase